MVTRALCPLLVLLLVACQGHDSSTTKPAATHHDASSVVALSSDAADVGSAGSAGNAGSAGSGSDDGEPPPPDPGKLISDLGAVPAWEAVVSRGQYLARRGQHGVVFGTLGPQIQIADPATDGGLVPSQYTWLVDDTEGNGALAIRITLGKFATKAKQGDRLALAGAWKLDETLHYYWDVAELSALPPAPPTGLKDPPSQPGHELASGPLPAGGHTITVAKDDEIAYFMVTGRPPTVDGDGWPIANELGDPVYALLNLPGERPSFGAQDFRTPDERWQLKRGVTYWVRIGKVRKHGPDKPATINARTAPVKLN